MISFNDYVTASGKYPERLNSPELTADKVGNAHDLLDKVNALFAELGVTGSSVSSGFRTSAVNAGTFGAAPHSHHMTGDAVDIEDADGKLHALMKANAATLDRYALWFEERQGGWQHIQRVPPGSGHKWFFP